MAPTTLLGLPDEILEIVIDKLIQSIGTRAYGTLNVADVQPVFPARPYGATGLVSLRQTCRRLQALVDGRSMQSIAIWLCATRDDVTQPKCTQKHAPAPGAPDSHCWHILQPDSRLKGRIKHLVINICYWVEDERFLPISLVRRVEAELTGALQAVGSTVETLHLKVFQQGEYLPLPPERDAIAHNGIVQPFKLPALRSLRLDDASLYFFLPALALQAPLLESVTLKETLARVSAETLREYVKGTFAAAKSDRVRLPPSGAWKELVITVPECPGPSNSVLFSEISFATDKLLLGHNGWQLDEALWRVIFLSFTTDEEAREDSIIQCASDALVSGQVGSLCFRLNCQRPIRLLAGPQLVKKQAAMSESIRAEVERKGGDPNVPITWNE